MKKLLTTIVGCALLSVNAFSLDRNSEFKAFMMKMLPRVDKAIETKNYKFFEAISAPDFTETDMGKTFNRKQAMAQMKQEMSTVKSSTCKFKLLSSNVSGNVGNANTFGSMTMVIKPMKKGDKNHTMHMDVWMKETWVKSGNGWKIQHLEEAKPSKVTRDGKPFDPSKMMGGGK